MASPLGGLPQFTDIAGSWFKSFFIDSTIGLVKSIAVIIFSTALLLAPITLTAWLIVAKKFSLWFAFPICVLSTIIISFIASKFFNWVAPDGIEG